MVFLLFFGGVFVLFWCFFCFSRAARNFFLAFFSAVTFFFPRGREQNVKFPLWARRHPTSRRVAAARRRGIAPCRSVGLVGGQMPAPGCAYMGARKAPNKPDWCHAEQRSDRRARVLKRNAQHKQTKKAPLRETCARFSLWWVADSPGNTKRFLYNKFPGAFYVGSFGIALNPTTRRYPPRLVLVAGSRGARPS